VTDSANYLASIIESRDIDRQMIDNFSNGSQSLTVGLYAKTYSSSDRTILCDLREEDSKISTRKKYEVTLRCINVDKVILEDAGISQ
jgi:hypothetical protein